MKNIKFNLKYQSIQICNLEELKTCGNIDLLLDTLESGLLERWLLSQGETKTLEKVKTLDKSNPRIAADELCKIFYGKESADAQKTVAELFDFRKKETERLEKLGHIEGKETEVIEQYHKGYEDILAKLKEHNNDYPALKAEMQILYKRYRMLLKLDFDRFYSDFKNDCPLVLLALMAHQQLPEYCFNSTEQVQQVYKDVLPRKSTSEVDMKWKEIRDAVYSGNTPPIKAIKLDYAKALQDFKQKYAGLSLYHFSYTTRYEKKRIKVEEFQMEDYYCPSEIEELLKYKNAFSSFPSHVKIFQGETNGYWKDIEPKGKTCMIIHIESGNFLRSSGHNGEELKDSDINGKFIFTDGIDYKSNSKSDKLIYMEV